MRHCIDFRPEDVYFLKENDIYSYRKLSIGFCPNCLKPVAELIEYRFDGQRKRTAKSGFEANEMMLELKDEIVYSMKQCNFSKFRSKPFGWRYGINKLVKRNGREIVKQYASDFYGNKELIRVS